MSSIDMINEDAILCLIISRLTLREAVRTCVLSRRWRYIWTHLSELQLDAPNILHLTIDHPEPCESYAPEYRDKFRHLMNCHVSQYSGKFIAAVNSFLSQHQGVGLGTFRIRYILNQIHSQHLDAWVDFAVASKIRSLLLHLGTCWLNVKQRPEPYKFPCHLLESSSIQCLMLQFCELKPPLEFGGLSCLKNLNLDQVNVTGDDIRRLLSNCYTLEYLAVKESQTLVTLSISHPLSQLKFLKVIFCQRLMKIEIKAINLTFLHYRGPSVELMLGGSSHLTDAVIHFKSCNMDSALTMLSNNLPFLRDLEFAINGNLEGDLSLARNSSRFIHLKHLMWQVPSTLHNKKGYQCLAALLRAAPFLKKLTIQYGLGSCLILLEEINEPRPSSHTHLESVEFIGYNGDMWQTVNAVYVLNNAIKLESMTLHKAYVGRSKESEKLFQKRKEYLQGRAPENVRLVFM